MELVEYTEESQMRAAYAVMHELRTELSEDEYMALLSEMVPAGYRLFAATDEGDIKALAGVAFRTNFYYGRYVWVYDLITTDAGRSKGYGAALLGHIEELARERGCDTIALASAFHRVDAHRFYEDKMSYTRAGYDFVKKL